MFYISFNFENLKDINFGSLTILTGNSNRVLDSFMMLNRGHLTACGVPCILLDFYYLEIGSFY